MNTTLVYIWIIIILIVIYPYTLYPIILFFCKRKIYSYKQNYLPRVSFIISAFNEEKVITNKIQNTLKLEYPSEMLEIIIASDGSTDSTTDICEQFEQVKVLDLNRRGKTAAQNEATKHANGDILVFSDANTMYDKQAIGYLTLPFSDSTIGCVCGQLKYYENGVESTYWSFEKFIKKHEGKQGKLLGTNGGIYAVRSTAYVNLDNAAISDLIEPIKVYEKGLDVVFQANAIAWENEPKYALARKRRIILRSLQSIRFIRKQLKPLSSRSVAGMFLSHKFIRWMMPVFLLLQTFILGLLIQHTIFRFILCLQLIFLSSAIIIPKIRYFIKINMAALLALGDWLLKRKIVVWKTRR